MTNLSFAMSQDESLTRYRLTIFLVALADWALPNKKTLSPAAIGGGLLIIAAFLLLSWSTYREMNEERRKRYVLSLHPSPREISHLPCSRLEDDIIESESDE